MNLKKGFTLIELLVVVAIVGLLAAVVLAALNTARSKGGDAGVKVNLKNAVSQGEIFNGTNTLAINTYTNVCVNGTAGGATGVGLFILTAAKASGLTSYVRNAIGAYNVATCNSDDTNGTAWAAEVPLAASKSGAPVMWCVDSSGKSKQETDNLSTTTDYSCT